MNSESVDSSLSMKEIRARLRRELPASALQTDPRRLLWAIPLTMVAIAGWWSILGPLEAWWSKLVAGLMVAHALGALIFLGHEAMHGAMGGTRRLQNAIAWIGFGSILVPPDFWRVWHNRMHHGSTNHKVKDPDHFGTLSRYKKESLSKKLLKYSPGSGHPLSYLFCCYNFSLHSTIILWTLTHRHPSFKSRSWEKEKLQSVLLIAAWIALAVYSGWDAVYTVLIPLAGANFLTQVYIVTNHALRPLTRTNEPLANSMSLVVSRWLDPLHFRFSHHAEHHIMPGLGSNQLPKVRQWLIDECPGELALITHGEALKWLYSTPRTYRTNTELAAVSSPDKVFDLTAFGDYLTSHTDERPKATADMFWRVRPVELGKAG